MLRNSFLESYQTHRKKLSEFEKEILAHDENHILNLQRPLSARNIGKLPNGILQTFIDDIMCNKNINNLLYSSNANKELLFYLKQKNFFRKNGKVGIKQNPFDSKKKRRPAESVFLKKKKDAMLKIIKDNITEFKNNKSLSMKLLKKKNNSFHKKQVNITKLFIKLFFKPVNDIRIEGYKKAVEDCLDRSDRYENFPLPDISFNMNDVYSRLYNNAILKPIKLKNKDNDTKTKSTNYCNRNNFSNITGYNSENNYLNSESFKYKKINKTKIFNSLRKGKTSSLFNKKNNNKKIINDYNSYYAQNKKRLPIFNLKKILTGNEGKEFSIKPSISIYQRCWSNNSGGPKIKKKLYKKMLKNAFDSDSSYISDTKTNELIDVNSYRDGDKNSNLIIAAKRNNEKFVEYFLEKKYNPNEKNKYGDTALHYAMRNNNKEIIKLLLDKGADIDIKNNKRITPYDLASKEIKTIFKLDNIILMKREKKYYY